MRGTKLTLVAATAAAMLAPGCAAAEVQRTQITPLDYLPALTGGYFPLQSREAGHMYHIYVRVPQGYAEQPERRYPIVYLLDGDSLYPIIAQQTTFSSRSTTS